MATRRQTQAALHYISGIRNSAKQAYANHYHMHLVNGHPEPNEAEFACSSMAKQAVRLMLRSIFNSASPAL